jgi:hypothetical protein
VVIDDKKDVYQDSVSAPLNREHDDDAGGDADREDIQDSAERLGEVLTAIPKL